jgi:hypothetical protein
MARQVYRIKPEQVFQAADVIFFPGQEYMVSEDLYNGKTSDNRDFKDVCGTAIPETVQD